MLLSVAFAILVCLATLLIPGTIALAGSGMGVQRALCCSAPVSLGLLALGGIVLDPLGASNATGVTAFSLMSSIAVYCLVKRLHPPETERALQKKKSYAHDWAMPALYALVGCATIYVTFVAQMEGADSFVQFDDNATHLGMISAMSEGASYSALKTTVYPSLPADQTPFSLSSFYPNAWHIVAAIVCETLGCTAPIAENATNIALVALVYPLGTCALLGCLIGERNRVAVSAGAFTCLASIAFPLRMLTVHGAFPNLAAFCCLPALAVLFVSLLPSRGERLFDPRLAAGFLIASAGCALTHPNSIFTASLLLLPYLLLNYLPRLIPGQGWRGISRSHLLLLARGLLCLAYVGMWLILFNSSLFSDIVDFVWQFSRTLPEALWNVLTAGYYARFPQYLLGALIIVGLVRALRSGSLRWVGISYILIALVFVLGLTLDYETRRLISGFWYNDPERTAAMVAIAAVPLSSLGLWSVAQVLTGAWLTLQKRLAHRPLHARRVAAAALLVAAAAFTCVNYDSNPMGNEPSPFGFASDQVRRTYRFSDDQVYTARERSFVQHAKELVGEDALVLNNPFDGSAFAYAADGINVYYKSCRPSNETQESASIRMSLNEISSSRSVQDAVKKTGARYLLLLDGPKPTEGDVYTMLGDYRADIWAGLNVDDDTQGFELVLSDGVLRLYKIVCD